jgi:1-acyl-sn-glycerol-3-phosphate acyltransferase
MIYSRNIFYSILLRYVKFVYRFAFSKIDIRGRENIPTDGAVIFAPNHTNAFMDAFTVLVVACKAVVFVARADVFRNKIAARIFRFLKIMPIMRMRDGRENLKKNEQIMKDAVEVLCHDVPFGIFCEGTHRTKHSILPLVKGIFRIALQADDALRGMMPVYIVPIGIEYGDFTRYRSTISVEVGEAFNVTEFKIRNVDRSQPELMNLMRSELTMRISSLFHCVPDNDDYDAILYLSYFRNRDVLARYGWSTSPFDVMRANRIIVNELLELKERDLDAYMLQIEQGRVLAQKCCGLGISVETIYGHRTVSKSLFYRSLGVLLGVPYFVFAAIVDFPVWLITWMLFYFVIEDEAMKNSLRMLIIALVYPFIFLVLGFVLCSNFSLVWAIILFILALPANIVVHEYVKNLRLLISDYRFKFLFNK